MLSCSRGKSASETKESSADGAVDSESIICQKLQLPDPPHEWSAFGGLQYSQSNQVGGESIISNRIPEGDRLSTYPSIELLSKEAIAEATWNDLALASLTNEPSSTAMARGDFIEYSGGSSRVWQNQTHQTLPNENVAGYVSCHSGK